ncbi:MAG: hypothetical protein WC723_00445 [Candidatus Omnitrophota bacterium]
MNKNTVYLAVFGVLCVLAGVLVGAGVANKRGLPCLGLGRPRFAEKAERFMGYGPRQHGERAGRGSLIDMLSVKLDLNGEQRAKVAEILEKARQDIEEVGKSIRGTMAEIKNKGDNQIMSILTPQQQEKFKALLSEFKKGCGGSRGPEGRRGPEKGYGPGPGEEVPLP